MKRTLDKILAFFFCVGVFTGGASFNCIIFVVATNLCACGYYPNNGAPDCQRF